MLGKREFLEFIKEEYECSTVFQFVSLLVAKSENDDSVCIDTILQNIRDNYSKNCYEDVLYNLKKVFLSNSRRDVVEDYNLGIELDVEEKVIMRRFEESVVDDYSGCLKDDFFTYIADNNSRRR